MAPRLAPASDRYADTLDSKRRFNYLYYVRYLQAIWDAMDTDPTLARWKFNEDASRMTPRYTPKGVARVWIEHEDDAATHTIWALLQPDLKIDPRFDDLTNAFGQQSAATYLMFTKMPAHHFHGIGGAYGGMTAWGWVIGSPEVCGLDARGDSHIYALERMESGPPVYTDSQGAGNLETEYKSILAFIPGTDIIAPSVGNPLTNAMVLTEIDGKRCTVADIRGCVSLKEHMLTVVFNLFAKPMPPVWISWVQKHGLSAINEGLRGLNVRIPLEPRCYRVGATLRTAPSGKPRAPQKEGGNDGLQDDVLDRLLSDEGYETHLVLLVQSGKGKKKATDEDDGTGKQARSQLRMFPQCKANFDLPPGKCLVWVVDEPGRWTLRARSLVNDAEDFYVPPLNSNMAKGLAKRRARRFREAGIHEDDEDACRARAFLVGVAALPKSAQRMLRPEGFPAMAKAVINRHGLVTSTTIEHSITTSKLRRPTMPDKAAHRFDLRFGDGSEAGPCVLRIVTTHGLWRIEIHTHAGQGERIVCPCRDGTTQDLYLDYLQETFDAAYLVAMQNESLTLEDGSGDEDDFEDDDGEVDELEDDSEGVNEPPVNVDELEDDFIEIDD